MNELVPMGSVIHKFWIEPANRDEFPRSFITVPIGSRVLSVGVQNSDCYAWVLVTNSAAKQTVAILFIGTGRLVPAGTRFLQTLFDQQYVWHVFVEEVSNG